jgi:hypothetical protein
MARDTLVELVWPTGGFVENSAISDQPEGTTPSALNVRNYDIFDRRLRGGQRPGTEPYVIGTINGSNSIQALTQSILAFDSNLVEADTVLQADISTPTVTDDFEYSDGTLETASAGKWITYSANPIGNINFAFQDLENDANSIQISSNAAQLTALLAGAGLRGAALASPPALGNQYVLTYNVNMPDATGSNNIGDFYACWRMSDDPTADAGFNGYSLKIIREAAAVPNDISYHFQVTAVGSGTTNPTGVGQTVFESNTSDDPFSVKVEIIVNGDIVNIKLNDVTVVANHTMASLSGKSNVGFMLEQQSAASQGNPSLNNVTFATGLTPAYSGTKAGMAVAGSGSSIFQAATGDIALQPAFQKVYMSDGLTYKILDAATNTVSDWQTSMTAGSLPFGGNGLSYTITAVDVTAGTFTVAEDLSTILASPNPIEIRESTGNNGTYTVSSTSGTGPTVVTVNETIQNATVDGLLIKGNVTCKILALYRGRMVLTALETDPHNIFFLVPGDPLDADYFPTVTSQTQAVAANFNKTFGILGDVVTAFATYTDDMAIIGMANSLAVLRGEPAAGGQVDNISDKIGIVGSEAWTFDTSGIFYFMGVNGFYKMDLGTFQPVLISQGKLDKTFSDIDTAVKRVQLEYDPKWQGVHIFVKSQIQQSTTKDTHYFWDERTNSFWPDEYPLVQGPLSAYRFTADDPEENGLLFGCYDGIIRVLGDSALDDDGTVIPSHVRFTPLTGGDILAASRIHDITVITDANSGDTVFKLYTGDTVESAEARADAGTVRLKRTIVGGRNRPMRQRVAHNAIIPELSQEGVDGAGASWAFEKAIARVAVVGRMHGKGV